MIQRWDRKGEEGTTSGSGELEVIARIRRAAGAARSSQVAVGIGDDCAVLQVPKGMELLVTTDFCLEGRHFRRDWHTPESVGHRCLARGLSDVAAMGGRPVAAFLSLGLPRDFEVKWLDGFLKGLLGLGKTWGVELAGGDTSEAPGEQILADIVVTGVVERGRAMVRSGARVGDLLYVTGRLGGAAAELDRLRAGKAKAKRKPGRPGQFPQTFPEPRVEVGRELVRRRLATACMDLSDGLSSDVRRICEASGVGAEIWAESLPVAKGATQEQALGGGEDYELLFTARPKRKVAEEIGGVAVRRVGRVIGAEEGVVLVGEDGVRRELEAGGWEHLQGRG